MSAWKAADRAARDRDEREGKERAGEHRSGAVDEPRERRHLERRQHDENADRQRDHDADLHERGEIVARREQQPHRKDRRREAVDHEQHGQRPSAQREDRGEIGLSGDPASGVEGEGDEQHEADRARLEHAARADPAHVDAHQHRDRNRESDRHRSPRARLERVHDHEREHRDQHDHDAEHRDERGVSGDGADLFLRHLAERFAVAPNGRAEDDEVLHRAADHDADDDPQNARQIAELRGERGSHERTGPGDGGEVMAEHDPLVGGHEVATVGESFRGRLPLVVEREDFRGDEGAVEAIRDGVGADGGDEQPRRADRLAAREREPGECAGAGECDHRPHDGGGAAAEYASRLRRHDRQSAAWSGEGQSSLRSRSVLSG